MNNISTIIPRKVLDLLEEYIIVSAQINYMTNSITRDLMLTQADKTQKKRNTIGQH